MTIVPISMLSGADLELLGNNFARRRRRAGGLSIAAVNRSLAIHGEQVSRLLARGAGEARRSRKVA
jgi:hypothetical protein